MSERVPANTIRPSIYEGDHGWTPDFQKEAEKIWNRIRKGEDKRKILDDLSSLIDKVQERVQMDDSLLAGTDIPHSSQLLTTLLSTYYTESRKVDR